MPRQARPYGSLDARVFGDEVYGDDDILGEPDGETGEYDGVGCMGQVICIYPCTPFRPWRIRAK